MNKMGRLLAAACLLCGQAALADEFSNVKCGADIPKALIGQRVANEKILTLESRNRALGLKHLGADEVSDRLSAINYLICGSEFVLLKDRQGGVRDVIAFPVHSKQSPAFSGICRVDGREQSGVYIGVLKGDATGDWCRRSRHGRSTKRARGSSRPRARGCVVRAAGFSPSMAAGEGLNRSV